MRGQTSGIWVALQDFFLVLVPPIFFGTVVWIGPVIIPLQAVTILGVVGLVQCRVPAGKLVGSILWLWVAMALLLLGTLLACGGELGVDDIKQLAMRISFVFYSVALFIRLLAHRQLSPAAVRAALITLRVLFLYGLYELLAKTSSFPLPLTFLLNNPSYNNALAVTSELSGWLEFYRAQSIWPEPSFAIFPIILYWVLSDGERVAIKKLDVAIMVAFALATFSRTVWIGLFVIMLTRLPMLRDRSMVLAIGLAIAFSFAFVNLSSSADHSASVRAETTRYGFEIASKEVYRGIGFNRFKDTEYAKITQESVIHNTISSYVASMGWPVGLALVLLFLWPLLAPQSRELAYLAPLAVVLVFTTSDAFYFTPVYFLIAYGRAKNLSVRSVVS